VSIIDHLTKRAHFLPLTEKGLTARTFAAKFTEFYIRLHAVPDMIVSDQDPCFIGDIWRALMHTLQVKHGILSVYHLQTDGQTDQVNHIISTYLRAFSRHNPDSWHDLLPIVEFAYNSSVHASTRKIPFELDLGYTPTVPIDTAVRNALNYTKTSRLDTMGISCARG
jgi:nucleoside-diphosphate-sugar epimerase